jgi:hypothetical protein
MKIRENIVVYGWVLFVVLATFCFLVTGSAAGMSLSMESQKKDIVKNREQLLGLQKSLPQLAQNLKTGALVSIDTFQKQIAEQAKSVEVANSVLANPYGEVKKWPVYLLTLQGFKTVPAGELVKEPVLDRLLQSLVNDITAKALAGAGFAAAPPLVQSLKQVLLLVNDELLAPLKKGITPLVQTLDPNSDEGKQLYADLQKAIDELALVEKNMTEFGRYEKLFQLLAKGMGLV